MNHSELITSIAEASKVSKKDVETVLSTLVGVAQAELQAGGEVAIHGIGKLRSVQKAARKGRNPKTGAAIVIPAKWAAAFSASKPLKDALALQA